MKSFDICIDKGTFDAISLSPEDREEAKKHYMASLRTVLQPNGFFIITSCNWTKEQLLQIFKPGTEVKTKFFKYILFCCKIVICVCFLQALNWYKNCLRLAFSLVV